MITSLQKVVLSWNNWQTRDRVEAEAACSVGGFPPVGIDLDYESHETFMSAAGGFFWVLSSRKYLPTGESTGNNLFPWWYVTYSLPRENLSDRRSLGPLEKFDSSDHTYEVHKQRVGFLSLPRTIRPDNQKEIPSSFHSLPSCCRRQ